MEDGNLRSGVEGIARRLSCPECGGQLKLRPSHHRPFYGCENYPECDVTHGAHPDGRPLGVPGDKATREARQRAHEAFDPLWKDALRMYNSHARRVRGDDFLTMVARSRAYAWLAHRLGLTSKEAHIGAFDTFTCELVVQLSRHETPESIRRWSRDRSHRKKVAKVIRRHGGEQIAIDSLLEDEEE